VSKKIYVGNLPQSATEIDVSIKFRDFGTVASIRLIEDRTTGENVGYGFVEMGTEREAKRAIEALDGSDYDGWQLTVKTAIAQGTDAPGGRR
jgi:RNA recognition motif-containing protein